jgi:hypothetical protein
MVKTLIQLAVLEQLFKRAIFSIMINYLFSLSDSNAVKSANCGCFVSFAHAALVTRDYETSEDSNNRDHDEKFDQRKALVA